MWRKLQGELRRRTQLVYRWTNSRNSDNHRIRPVYRWSRSRGDHYSAAVLIFRRLSAALVESGGLRWDRETQELADFEIEGPSISPRRKSLVFEPSEAQVRISWGGVCLPLDPMDFEKRPWIPNSGWPITRKSLDPYYSRALKICGVRVMNQYPQEPATKLKKVSNCTDNYHLRPVQFRYRLSKKIESTNNIKAILHSSVRKIRCNSARQRVESVEILSA